MTRRNETERTSDTRRTWMIGLAVLGMVALTAVPAAAHSGDVYDAPSAATTTFGFFGDPTAVTLTPGTINEVTTNSGLGLVAGAAACPGNHGQACTGRLPTFNNAGSPTTAVECDWTSGPTWSFTPFTPELYVAQDLAGPSGVIDASDPVVGPVSPGTPAGASIGGAASGATFQHGVPLHLVMTHPEPNHPVDALLTGTPVCNVI